MARHALTSRSFFDEVKRIAGPDYTPTEADVLRARTKTTGIYETRFTMGQLSIQFVSPNFAGLVKANQLLACLMSGVNEVNGRSGFIASKM
jgi:hypothetical protein